MADQLIIIGASGFGSEACWVAQEMNAQAPRWEIIGLADDDPQRRGKRLLGFPVIGSPEQAARELSGDVFFHCAVGQNRDREQLVERAESLGWRPATLVHPGTGLGPESEIGEGSYVAQQVVVGPGAKIGRHVLLNTFVGVGHHSVLEDFSQACPGVRISGHCWIGKGALLGSNAVVNPGVRVGERATVAASSLAITNVEPGVTVLGVPGKSIS